MHKQYMFVRGLPDSHEQTLLLDFSNQSQFSTYLDNDMVLIGLNGRYILFNKDGKYINECIFDKIPDRKNPLIVDENELNVALDEEEEYETVTDIKNA